MSEPGLNILLLEDDEVDIMNLRRSFKKNGISYPVTIARNGEEALELLTHSPLPPTLKSPLIILADINMPRMNGLEFLETLRNTPGISSIPVFILTTSDHKADIEKAHRLNVAGFIKKPLSFEEFNEMIATLRDFWEICLF